jgi:hypothetical protein
MSELPPGDRGVTTVNAHRDRLMVPMLNGDQHMVIPEAWSFWMCNGIFYSRVGAIVFATDERGYLFELIGPADHTVWTWKGVTNGPQ